MVTIQLTDKQAEYMLDALWDCSDCGPPGSGWASDELMELRCIVDKAITSSTISDNNHDTQ